jgi:hypothetical protein
MSIRHWLTASCIASRYDYRKMPQSNIGNRRGISAIMRTGLNRKMVAVTIRKAEKVAVAGEPLVGERTARRRPAVSISKRNFMKFLQS